MLTSIARNDGDSDPIMDEALRRARQGEVIRMDWRHNAICADQANLELFFPIGNTGPALLQIEEAKTVCRRCQVQEQCLQWALDSGQNESVWGGLSEYMRQAMKRRAARKRARTAVA